MKRQPRIPRHCLPLAEQTLAMSARRPTGAALSPFLSVLLAALLLGALPARGQESDNELFIERVDINVINVEAFVTDRDGKSVNDLTAEDFEVLEDGKPVEITNFFKNDPEGLGVQLDRDRQLLDQGRRGSAPVAVPAPRDVPEDQRQNLVVYVDLFNMRPANRTRVLKQLGGFLEDRLYQGDRIMMVAHQKNLQMVHPFTQDITRVVKGIEKVAKMDTGGPMMDAERRRIHNMLFIQSGNDADAGGDQMNALEAIKLFVQQQRLETESSMQALQTVLRSLGGVPGRRALLYVSDGLEQTPGSDLFQTYREIYGVGARAGNLAPQNPGIEMLRNDLSKVFDTVAQAANTYQVTLYTLQARGAAAMSSISASEGDVSAGLGGRTTANSMRGLAEQEPLISLAEQTGGSAIVNTSNYGGALESLSRDFNSLYSLGYRSRTGGDGKYHKIDVKVKRPGLKVRHRNGYVDSPQDQRVADRAFSSLILDMESNPLGVTVEFATPQQEGINKYHLPLLVQIPVSQVTLLPSGDKVKGKLRLFFAVQDPDGAISQVQEIPYPVEISADQMEAVKEKGIGYAVKLAVREGTPKIAVSVWDEISGTESYLLRSVPVGKTAEKKATQKKAAR